jgi:hypothetical protein
VYTLFRRECLQDQRVLLSNDFTPTLASFLENQPGLLEQMYTNLVDEVVKAALIPCLRLQVLLDHNGLSGKINFLRSQHEALYLEDTVTRWFYAAWVAGFNQEVVDADFPRLVVLDVRELGGEVHHLPVGELVRVHHDLAGLRGRGLGG